MNYLKMLVEEFHSTTVATIGEDGRPQTRIIDMMLYDEKGVYFLTAKGKAFYAQLMDQKYIAISATKEKKAISLRGHIQNIGAEKLDEIFEKNPYMQKIYPDDTRKALEVFRLYEAQGEYFDITYAGVQLRLECARIMQKQGYEEPTGQAKITSAYNLPCRYVLHTVGPIIYNRVTKRDEELLASCYHSCLELAEEKGLHSVAFCCISTGVFRFPNRRAAEIAIQTVQEYRKTTGRSMEVIFNVFKQEDFEIYRKLLGTN